MLNAEREIDMKAKRKYKIDKVKFTAFILTVCFMVFLVISTVNFVRYPEQYVTTWKYQMENELAKGNKETIKYYNDVYVSNGKYLFGDKYIIANN